MAKQDQDFHFFLFTIHDYVKPMIKSNRHPANKKQSGLTLLELVIAIIIMGIIGTATSSYLLNSVQAYFATESNINALTKSRLIDIRLETELREINFNSIGAGFNNTNLSYTNIDTVTAVEINYNAVSNNLELNYDAITTTLSDNITVFTFNYYRENLTTVIPGTDPASDIIFIEYSYSISEDGVTYSSTGRVMPRDRQ